MKMKGKEEDNTQTLSPMNEAFISFTANMLCWGTLNVKMHVTLKLNFVSLLALCCTFVALFIFHCNETTTKKSISCFTMKATICAYVAVHTAL